MGISEQEDFEGPVSARGLGTTWTTSEEKKRTLSTFFSFLNSFFFSFSFAYFLLFRFSKKTVEFIHKLYNLAA